MATSFTALISYVFKVMHKLFKLLFRALFRSSEIERLIQAKSQLHRHYCFPAFRRFIYPPIKKALLSNHDALVDSHQLNHPKNMFPVSKLMAELCLSFDEKLSFTVLSYTAHNQMGYDDEINEFEAQENCIEENVAYKEAAENKNKRTASPPTVSQNVVDAKFQDNTNYNSDSVDVSDPMKLEYFEFKNDIQYKQFLETRRDTVLIKSIHRSLCHSNNQFLKRSLKIIVHKDLTDLSGLQKPRANFSTDNAIASDYLWLSLQLLLKSKKFSSIDEEFISVYSTNTFETFEKILEEKSDAWRKKFQTNSEIAIPWDTSVEKDIATLVKLEDQILVYRSLKLCLAEISSIATFAQYVNTLLNTYVDETNESHVNLLRRLSKFPSAKSLDENAVDDTTSKQRMDSKLWEEDDLRLSGKSTPDLTKSSKLEDEGSLSFSFQQASKVDDENTVSLVLKKESMSNLPPLQNSKLKYSEKYRKLGFLSEDVQHNFQVGGYLSLLSLIFFSEHQHDKFSEIFFDQHLSFKESYACGDTAGSLMRYIVVESVNNGWLDEIFYRKKSESMLRLLHEYFIYVFQQFHKFFKKSKLRNASIYHLRFREFSNLTQILAADFCDAIKNDEQRDIEKRIRTKKILGAKKKENDQTMYGQTKTSQSIRKNIELTRSSLFSRQKAQNINLLVPVNNKIKEDRQQPPRNNNNRSSTNSYYSNFLRKKFTKLGSRLSQTRPEMDACEPEQLSVELMSEKDLKTPANKGLKLMMHRKKKSVTFDNLLEKEEKAETDDVNSKNNSISFFKKSVFVDLVPSLKDDNDVMNHSIPTREQDNLGVSSKKLAFNFKNSLKTFSTMSSSVDINNDAVESKNLLRANTTTYV